MRGISRDRYSFHKPDQRLHRLDQFSNAIGLRKEYIAVNFAIGQMRRAEDDLQIGVILPYEARETDPVDRPGHSDVGEEKADGLAQFENEQRFIGAATLDDRKACIPQFVREHAPDNCFIIDDEDSTGGLGRSVVTVSNMHPPPPC